MAKDKYEVHAGTTRWTTTRADGSALVLEVGEEREPKDAEEAQLLAEAAGAAGVPVKKVEGKGKG